MASVRNSFHDNATPLRVWARILFCGRHQPRIDLLNSGEF